MHDLPAAIREAGMIRHWITSASLATLLLATGCEHENYTYVPEETVTAAGKNPREINYPIWGGPREGTVKVTFLGLSDVELKKGEAKTRTARIRLDAKNDTQAAWTLDVRDNNLEIPGYGQVRAAYVQTVAGRVPEVDISPGVEQNVDFFFPLPEAVKAAAEMPDFTFHWMIRTPTTTITQKTLFERVHLEHVVPQEYAYPAYAYGAEVWGPGPYWWYEPNWEPWPYVAPPPPPSGPRAPTPPPPHMLPPKKK